MPKLFYIHCNKGGEKKWKKLKIDRVWIERKKERAPDGAAAKGGVSHLGCVSVTIIIEEKISEEFDLLTAFLFIMFENKQLRESKQN